MRVWEKIFKLHITKAYYPWREHAPSNKVEKDKRPNGKMSKECKQGTEEEIKMASTHMCKQGNENSIMSPHVSSTIGKHEKYW